MAGLWLVTASGASWDGLLGDGRPYDLALPSTATSTATLLAAAGICATWAWLALLLPRAAGHARWWPLSVSTACVMLYLANIGGFLPDTCGVAVRDVSSGVVLVCLALALTSRHAMPLRPFKRRGLKGSGVVVGLAAFLAFLLVPVLRDVIDRLPGPHMTETRAFDTVTDMVVHLGLVAVTEELILTATPLALLVAARFPAWQCVVVVMVLRLVPHAYMEMNALPLLWAAAACTALYLVSRRVLPLIVAHFVYDLIAPFLPSPFAAPLVYLTMMLTVVFVGAATVLVVTERPQRAPSKGAV